MLAALVAAPSCSCVLLLPQRRTKFKADLGLDDKYNVESSDEEGAAGEQAGAPQVWVAGWPLSPTALATPGFPGPGPRHHQLCAALAWPCQPAIPPPTAHHPQPSTHSTHPA